MISGGKKRERTKKLFLLLTGGADRDPLPPLEHPVLHDGRMHLALEGGVEAFLAELGRWKVVRWREKVERERG